MVRGEGLIWVHQPEKKQGSHLLDCERRGVKRAAVNPRPAMCHRLSIRRVTASTFALPRRTASSNSARLGSGGINGATSRNQSISDHANS